MKPNVFECTDFVQVKTPVIQPGGEPGMLWRNALYIANHGSKESPRHDVRYTDGSREVLNHTQKIRKAETK